MARARMGRSFLVIAFSICILQFIVQMLYVSHGWSAKWPYSWDQNRYFDYACFYRAMYERDGWSGLLAAYSQRPAYSLTLLATSLPFFALSRGQEILYWHLLLYVLVFDVAVARTVWHLTRSMRLSALALLTTHFTTQGIFGGSSMFSTVEAATYQVNFPVAVCVMASLAGLIEGASSRRGWQIATALFFSAASGLLLRGGAMPFFAILIFFPGAILVFGLFRFQERKRAVWASAGLAMACAVALFHYASIYHLVMNYVRSTVTSPRWLIGSRWETVWYYLEGAHRISWAFVLCLALIALFAVSRIVKGSFGKLTLRVDRWSRFRVLFVVGTVTWYLLLCYAIPTLMRTKVSGSQLAFLFLVLMAGVACSGSALRKKRRPVAHAGLFIGAAIVLAIASVVREYSAFRLEQRVGMKEPAEFVVRRQACEKVVEFIEAWAAGHGRDFVSFGVPASIDFPNSADVGVWQYQHARHPLRVREIRIDDAPQADPAGERPEIVFIPTGSPLVSTLTPGGAASPDYKALGPSLAGRDYHKTSVLEVTDGLVWEVYERNGMDAEFRGFNFP